MTPSGSRNGAVLYLHGGAFCLGEPSTYRSVTTRLAVESEMPVWVPAYRLAPEHPYPAALNDAVMCYDALVTYGYSPLQIIIAGDSAGGSLAVALSLRLRDRGDVMPAGLLLLSPITDLTLRGESMQSRSTRDPMVRVSWLRQGIEWYACPASASFHRPLDIDVTGLPPMLIHVGDDEVLLSDATRLAEHAEHCGVMCEMEVHEKRWHVFHLQAFYLASSRNALRALGAFARARTA